MNCAHRKLQPLLFVLLQILSYNIMELHKGQPRTALGKLVAGKAFHRISLFLVIAVCIIIGIETDREIHRQYFTLLHTLDRALILLFALEIVLRYWADVQERKARASTSYWRFFADPWHIIDCVIVLICLLPTHTEFFAVLRTLRILRVFLLVDELPRLKLLVNALVKSVPSMGYVMLLLMLHFYAYGVIATDIFGASTPQYFGNLGVSLFTLFQIVTGDGWSDILHTVETNMPGFSSIAITMYFISFIIIGAMIFLNLFIGVITNEIADLKAEHERQSRAVTPPPGIDATIHQLEQQLRDIQSTIAMLKEQRQGVS